ncbi:MAG: MoaD/ThiS family protein [Alphaproteobacteria bacterium]
MATVNFTAHLRRVAPAGSVSAEGDTVGAVLGQVFAGYPKLGTYVLDDQGRLRKHVAIFVDGERVMNDAVLDHEVRPDAEIYVMQALSGG